MEWVKN
ncbi:Protein of unknown function [Bacillus cereus]|nr:Protein of unknown function [Bacillus cereus]